MSYITQPVIDRSSFNMPRILRFAPRPSGPPRPRIGAKLHALAVLDCLAKGELTPDEAADWLERIFARDAEPISSPRAGASSIESA